MKPLKPNKFFTNFEGNSNFFDNLKQKNISKITQKKTVVKTAKNRKLSSTIWLQRQLNDSYTNLAKKEGYVSRAAYKLIEIHNKFKILNSGNIVVDLGAAPGGWVQVTNKLIGSKGFIIAVDLLPIKLEAKTNNIFLQSDFTLDTTVSKIKEHAPKVNVVLSDMAPNTTGNKDLDHFQIINLTEQVLKFSLMVLTENGSLVIKVFQGGLHNELVREMKQYFGSVKFFKPKSSHKESKEVYLVGLNFKSK